MSMYPSAALTQLRPDLTGSFMEYDVALQQYVGLQLFAPIEVAKVSGVFGRITLEEVLKPTDDLQRAPGADYKRVGAEFTQDSYACIEYGIEIPIDNREADMYSDYFDAEVQGGLIAQAKLLSAFEKRIVDAGTDASVWTGASLTTAVGTAWTTHASATPLANVNTAVDYVYENSGLRANTIIMGYDAYRNLRLCDEVQEVVKYQGFQDARASALNASALAQLFDVDRVLVAAAKHNTGTLDSATIAEIWPTGKVWVGVTAGPNSPITTPCVGRVFHWGQDGSSITGAAESYTRAENRSNIVRVRHDVDEVRILTEAAHILTGVTA